MKVLEQKKFMRGTKKVEVLDKGRVRFTQTSVRGKNEECLNLFDLDHESDRYLYRPFKYLVIGGMFVLPSIPFFTEAINNKDMVPIYIAFIFLGPALFCIQQYFHKITDVIVYRFRNNGHAAITLWNHKPNDKEIGEFVTEFSQEIKSLRMHPDLDISKKLEIYKNYLEFLLEEEVITPDEAVSIYERNKAKLLRNQKAKLFAV